MKENVMKSNNELGTLVVRAIEIMNHNDWVSLHLNENNNNIQFNLCVEDKPSGF